MRRPVSAPEHQRRVVYEALREELLDVVHIASPGNGHLERVEARVPCAKLCSATCTDENKKEIKLQMP